MYKKLISIIMFGLMLLTVVACSNQPNANESTDATDTTTETVPGVVDVDTPIQNPLDEDTDPTDAGTNDTADPTEMTTEPTDVSDNATEPAAESTDPSEEATEPSEEATTPEETTPSTTPENTATSYEAYIAMSAEEQLAFYNTFDSMESFVAWYNAAKAEYEAQHPDIDIGDGNIDAGDITGGNN